MRLFCATVLACLAFAASAVEEITLGGTLTTVISVDVDNDDDKDLVVGMHDVNPGQIKVLKNNGTGTFTPATYSTSAGQQKKPGIAAGDLNGDGFMDLVVGNDDGKIVYILINNGAGEFPTATPLTISTASKVPAIAIGNFDGVGFNDIAVVSKEGTAGVYICLSADSGAYTGAYAPAVLVPVSGKPCAIEAGHFNGDGRIDLAVAQESNGAILLMNSTATPGTFTAGTSVSVTTKPKSIAVGDMNSDGNLDVIVPGEDSGQVSVRFGDGNGGLSGTTNYPTVTSGAAKSTNVTVGDIDGDGKLDVAVCQKEGAVFISILFNNGSGGLSEPLTLTAGSGTQKGSGIVAAQLDGAGKLDIAAVTEGGSLFLFYGAPSPALASITPTSTAVFTTGIQIVATGTNFTTFCSIEIDGVAVTTNFVSATQLSTGGNIDSYFLTAGPKLITVSTTQAAFPPESAPQTLNVVKATPTVTWNIPSSMTYGEALSAMQLNATASVPGQFNYTPGVGTLLNAGDNQAIQLVFNPNDAANYNSVTVNKTLNVLKRPLEITADNKIKFVGATTPKFTATYTGLAFFDSQTAIPVVFSLPPGTDVNVPDEYTLSVALDTPNLTGKENNYQISLKAGVLSVLSPASITANSVGEEELKDDSVTSPIIAEADGTTGQDTNSGKGVKTGHIQDGAVTSGAIGQGGKISSGALSSNFFLVSDGFGGTRFATNTELSGAGASAPSLPSGAIIYVKDGSPGPANSTMIGLFKQKVQSVDPVTKKKKNISMTINVYQVN